MTRGGFISCAFARSWLYLSQEESFTRSSCVVRLSIASASEKTLKLLSDLRCISVVALEPWLDENWFFWDCREPLLHQLAQDFVAFAGQGVVLKLGHS